MPEYTFPQAAESPAQRRTRRLRGLLATVVAVFVSVAVGELCRHFFPCFTQGIHRNFLESAIAVAVLTLFGDVHSKAASEALRRNFQLTLTPTSITARRQLASPITISLSEIEAIYDGPARALWIASADRRLRITVPGTLDSREDLLRELAAFGIPRKSYTDWLARFALPAAVAGLILLFAAMLLWGPGPRWQWQLGAAVLLTALGWFALRTRHPATQNPVFERFLLIILASAVLWKAAHVLLGFHA